MLLLYIFRKGMSLVALDRPDILTFAVVRKGCNEKLQRRTILTILGYPLSLARENYKGTNTYQMRYHLPYFVNSYSS